ncbi:MAG: DUF488 domain-containing protein [Dehalobacterium sp.]
MIQIKRVYEELGDDDGHRILIDRLWPRGISKENAHIDLWLKEIAPSTELRKWFNHDPEKWEEFKKLYRDELSEKKEMINQIKELEQKHETVTLLFSAKDTEHANAKVLLEVLEEKKSK